MTEGIKEKVICFSCFTISETPKGIVAYCPKCKEVVMHTLDQIDESLINKIQSDAENKMIEEIDNYIEWIKRNHSSTSPMIKHFERLKEKLKGERR